MWIYRLWCVLVVLNCCAVFSLKADDAKHCEANTTITTKSASVVDSININAANADELSKLKGIGKAKAAAIIEWRETNGKFTSLEDVDEVKGIGPGLLEKNKALIRFED